jgi:tetratricopeptide (TPR) repeat protein
MPNPSRLYRAVFALGSALVAASFATGLYEAWRSERRVPGLDQSPFVRAERVAQTGDRARAAGEYRAAARLNSANISETLRSAEQLARLGDLRGAGELLELAERRVPGSPALRISLAWVLIHQKRVDAAETQLRAALEVLPGNAHAWAGLGEVHLDRGDHDPAIEAYRQSLRLSPNDASVHNSLGVAFAESGRLEEAIAAFETAVALAPGLFEDNLALAREEWRERDSVAAP